MSQKTIEENIIGIELYDYDDCETVLQIFVNKKDYKEALKIIGDIQASEDFWDYGPEGILAGLDDNNIEMYNIDINRFEY